jgi:hypothetical protein
MASPFSEKHIKKSDVGVTTSYTITPTQNLLKKAGFCGFQINAVQESK